MDTPDTLVQQPAQQLLLWIDGIGGYLVCLGHRITLGQMNQEGPPDIALLADVSRHHATMQRDHESYFLEAVRRVQVNGQPTEKAFLSSGDRITLGVSCQLTFTLPCPASQSARIEITSGHRLFRPVDAVLLMADTLVLGSSQAHVMVPELTEPVILHRSKTGLAMRHSGPLTIDGKEQKERGPIHPGSKVTAGPITLALEGVAKKGKP
jgi:hypothetical protein